MNEVNVRHTITIDERTYRKLRSKGNFGETYSELISRIIKNSDVYHGSVIRKSKNEGKLAEMAETHLSDYGIMSGNTDSKK